MKTRKYGLIPLFLFLIPLTIFIFFAQQVSAGIGGFEVVAGGLDNPRDIIFGDDGAMYIAEAGRGNFVGGLTSVSGELPPGCFNGPEGPVCYGDTGAITRVMNGVQERVVTNLPSLAGMDDGSGGTGPHGLAFDENGVLHTTIGLGGDPALRDETGPFGMDGANLGLLVSVDTENDSWAPVTDIAQHEADNNPDGDIVDSNPFGLASDSGGGMFIADAGGNNLLYYDGADITTAAVFSPTLAEFPPMSGNMIPSQAVPTDVEVDAGNGDVYVAELTGFPFPAGGAKIYRLTAQQARNGGGMMEVFADGFTNILGIELGADGSVYVLEMDNNGLATDGGTGQLTRIHPSGDREGVGK